MLTSHHRRCYLFQVATQILIICTMAARPQGRPRGQTEIVPAAQLISHHNLRQEVWRMEELFQALDNENDAMMWLARRGLLRNQNLCQVCGLFMTLTADRDSSDGKTWRCPNRNPRCNLKLSIRHQSWFHGSHLSLKQVIILVYMWVMEHTQTSMAHELVVNKNTVVDWSNFMREVCQEHLLAMDESLGGVDEVTGQPIIVEIDGSKFFHRKYHRGQYREGHWVFGAVERGTNRVHMQVVNDRREQTLTAIIERHILPGTHIMSDGWAAYANIDEIGGAIYSHSVVHHNANFVDPQDREIHTNLVEGSWMLAKRKLKRQCGTSDRLFHSYVPEFLWRRMHSAHPEFLFGKFLSAILLNFPLFPLTFGTVLQAWLLFCLFVGSAVFAHFVYFSQINEGTFTICVC